MTVCPLVGIGNLPPPLSPASVPPYPRNQRGGGHTRLRVRGWGSPNSDDWRKALHSAYSVGAPFQWHWQEIPNKLSEWFSYRIHNIELVRCGMHYDVGCPMSSVPRLPRRRHLKTIAANSLRNFSASPEEKLGRWGKKFGPFLKELGLHCKNVQRFSRLQPGCH